MGFLNGFEKVASGKSSEHHRAGVYAITAGGPAAAMYSAMKGGDEEKGLAKRYVIARAPSFIGSSLGSLLGTAAGVGAGHYALKLRKKLTKSRPILVPMPGVVKSVINSFVSRKQRIPAKSKLQAPLLLVAPTLVGTFGGGALGAYVGARKGHTLATGKKPE